MTDPDLAAPIDDDVRNARLSDPEGTYCGRCGATNQFADDCGWFYWYKNHSKETPVCSTCWNELGLSTAER